ncbi:MAG: FixH family protein [Arenimonas sp.]|uniref:FixH family protein n=1 Tax=Arenimonas sp. TaxID=1872635 RepID=UPI0025BDA243|nr:FixH family protein [Arenimonas sp.]MBW8369003.1 FixH family protein [Arenimonas sp.]
MIIIPACTVVAGFWTLWLAASESGVDTNPDTVRRTAQIQVSSLEPDENAARQGLRGRVVIEAGSVLVEVMPSAGTVAPQLQLVHPIENSLDIAVDLRPDPRGWRGDVALAGKQAWHLRVVAADGSWRLVGRYRPGDTQVQLEPAVSTR